MFIIISPEDLNQAIKDRGSDVSNFEVSILLITKTAHTLYRNIVYRCDLCAIQNFLCANDQRKESHFTKNGVSKKKEINMIYSQATLQNRK